MKFHSVHGSNVIIEDGGTRASRTSSFCDGITFSQKTVTVNSRITVLLTANEDWTGAIRLGLTTHDPNLFANKKLPRYLCPDLTSKSGYWARPLPETWAANGNRLTFYVNGRGQFHLFVNNDHKGAILTGIPLKEQLWIILDLYGISVSAKFVSNSGSAPTEVIARGPEAVQAYQHALLSGSTPYYHTRVAIIGPQDDKNILFKKLLLKASKESSEKEYEGIDTTCFCQTNEKSVSQPWTSLKNMNRFSVEDVANNNYAEIEEINCTDNMHEDDTQLVAYNDEEFFKAVATNIVREIMLQKKKDERKKTAGMKNAFRLQSSLSKVGTSKNKQDDNPNSKEIVIGGNSVNLPEDLPGRVVELVEKLLKESDNKVPSEKKELPAPTITFNIWSYSGHPKYLFLHQLFLSPQTIYIFVFDLAQDLNASITNDKDHYFEHSSDCVLSCLSLLHLWLEMIYVSIAYPKDESKDSGQEPVVNNIICTLFPPIFIVGIQEDSTTFDSVVEHQFNKIKESIQDKAFYHLVHPTFYYVGFPESVAVDSMISELREKIQEIALQLPHFGTEIPLKWMLFEQAVDRLVDREVYFADMCKLSEVARLEGVDSEDEFRSMVHFYHHRGKIWHLASNQFQRNESCSIVILKPQWFIDYIYKLVNEETLNPLKENSNANENSTSTDILTSKSFEGIWPNAFHHVDILLNVLDSTDILYIILEENVEVENILETSKLGIPWFKSNTFSEKDNFNFERMVFIIDFSGLLPVGFFTKFIVRLLRWSSRHDWKRNNCKFTEVPVDYNHSIKLQKIHGHRIQVDICKRHYLDVDEGGKLLYPSPHICTKVRHLLERETEYLRDVWYKRLSYSINIPCPCAKKCSLHEIVRCTDYQCIHLLPLNECLTKKVIECDYRLIKTDFIQKYFFSASIEGEQTNCPESIPFDCISSSALWNESDIIQEDLPWMTTVAKMLTSANTGQDWIALARRLSYNEREIKKFGEEAIPPISLLNHWINSNGRTRYCIDLLVSCLEQMNRQDVANYIISELGQLEAPSPPIFISYQWDSQDSVLQLRRRIELAGFPCWMDVGHMLGGDALYGKIYEGINNAKVILCCLTPRYVLSPLCTREMSLADVLRKPIVPIIIEPLIWPPPGALALILSPLVYIDLCGIGGHGGSGKQADWESRFSCIIERLSQYVTPAFLSTPGSKVPSERHPAPPVYIRNPEEFLDSLDSPDEQEITEVAQLPEEDSASDTASISPEPPAWQPNQRNRVIRCSVCTIL